jgi:hypothetical protein
MWTYSLPKKVFSCNRQNTTVGYKFLLSSESHYKLTLRVLEPRPRPCPTLTLILACVLNQDLVCLCGPQEPCGWLCQPVLLQCPSGNQHIASSFSVFFLITVHISLADIHGGLGQLSTSICIFCPSSHWLILVCASNEMSVINRH